MKSLIIVFFLSTFMATSTTAFKRPTTNQMTTTLSMENATEVIIMENGTIVTEYMSTQPAEVTSMGEVSIEPVTTKSSKR